MAPSDLIPLAGGESRALSASKRTPLTPAMQRELRSIVQHGQPGDLADYGVTHLAFHAREKVLTALIARGLIVDAETATEAGESAYFEMTAVRPIAKYGSAA
jgi:hypothetical protein